MEEKNVTIALGIRTEKFCREIFFAIKKSVTENRYGLPIICFERWAKGLKSLFFPQGVPHLLPDPFVAPYVLLKASLFDFGCPGVLFHILPLKPEHAVEGILFPYSGLYYNRAV
jgi:hypothetical protein